MLAETLMRLQWAFLVGGEYGRAIAYAGEALRLGQASNNLDAQALSQFLMGFVHLERGQIDKALATMSESVRLTELVDNLTPLVGTQADLGWTFGLLGAVDRGLKLADRARLTAEEKLPILRFLVTSDLGTAVSLPGRSGRS